MIIIIKIYKIWKAAAIKSNCKNIWPLSLFSVTLVQKLDRHLWHLK